MEIWKDIYGYEGLYKVSNLGNVISCERYVSTCGNGKRLIKPQILKHFYCPGGYLQVNLWKNNKSKTTMIHRLVAKTFIDNPNNLPEVNHKDEDKANNNVENLEWCTSKYNANYGTRNKRMVEKKKKKPVYMMDKTGNVIKRFNSLGDASRETGQDISAIIRVCKGKQKTSMGYKWTYVDTGGAGLG